MSFTDYALFGLLPVCSYQAAGDDDAAASSDDIGRLNNLEPTDTCVFTDATKSLSHYVIHSLQYAESINLWVGANHNLTDDAATFAIEFWTSTPRPPDQWTKETPNGSSGTVNLGGSHTDVDDDPDSPDANWRSATSASSDTESRYTFTDAGSTMQSGAAYQEFRCWVRRTAGFAPYPTVQIQLYDNGVFVRSLLTTAVEISSATGEIVSGYWNSSEVAGSANVECRIVGTAVGGMTIEHGAVSWVRYETDASRITTTGWQTLTGYDSVTAWGNTSPTVGGEPPMKTRIELIATAVTGAEAAIVMFRDRYNSSGTIEIGVSAFGFGAQVDQGENYQENSLSMTILPAEEVQRTTGMAGYGATQRQIRQVTAEFPRLKESTTEQLAVRLWSKNRNVPMLFCPKPTSEFALRFKTILGYATYSLTETNLAYDNEGGESGFYHTLSLTVTEA